VSYGSFTTMFVWSDFFSVLPKCSFVIIIFAYIYISQGSVKTHLLCGGIHNDHVIASCLWRVCQWKNFESLSKIGEDIDKSKEARFLAHPVYVGISWAYPPCWLCWPCMPGICSARWCGHLLSLQTFVWQTLPLPARTNQRDIDTVSK